MFDHVKFGASDYAASKAFFLKALEPLGVGVVSEWPPAYGVELGAPQGKTSLCLYQTQEKPAHLYLAFTAGNRQLWVDMESSRWGVHCTAPRAHGRTAGGYAVNSSSRRSNCSGFKT